MKMKRHWPVTSLDAQELTDLGRPHGRVARPIPRAMRGFVGTAYNTLRMSQNLLRFLVDLNAAYADDSLRPIPCNSSAFKACLAVNPEHMLNDVFCWIRENMFSVFIIPVWLPTRQNIRLRKNLTLLNEVRETLRLRSPAYVQSRVAVVDTELDGFKVDKGTVIFACQYITHLDPRFWKNPTQFDPERFLSGEKQSVSGTAYFPFGGGKQICIGMNYAVNEAKLVTILLLRSFRFSPRNARALAEVGVDARTTARPDRPIKLDVKLREEHHGRTTTEQVG